MKGRCSFPRQNCLWLKFAVGDSVKHPRCSWGVRGTARPRWTPCRKILEKSPLGESPLQRLKKNYNSSFSVNLKNDAKNVLLIQIPSWLKSKRLIHGQRNLLPGDEQSPEPSQKISSSNLSSNVPDQRFLSCRKTDQLSIVVFDRDGQQRVRGNCKIKFEHTRLIFCSIFLF